MRTAQETPKMKMDAVAEKDDHVEVRVAFQPFGKKVVYVDVNGETIFRLGHIEPDQVHVRQERRL